MIRPGRDILQFIEAPHVDIGIEGRVFGGLQESRAKNAEGGPRQCWTNPEAMH
jgi:hypothetical protein